MLRLKKYNNSELGIYDEKNKKFVPLCGENLANSFSHLPLDIREYFAVLSRKDLIYAAKVVLKQEEEE